MSIPQEHLAAATRGLTEAFGATAFDDIQDLTERPGSNRAFRIAVAGRRYLLRINTRKGDMARHFHCMQAAAEAGIAPRVWYANAEDRLAITDYVDSVSLPARDALRLVPAALRRLQALPPFPSAPFNTTCTFLLDSGEALDGFLRQFRDSQVLPERETDGLLAEHTRLTAVIASLPPDLAPSHNDLFKPDNMLFDGSRLWLVDWEASFQNDRYADLAVVANMLVQGEEDERIFLGEYLGTPPAPHQTARLRLMQRLAHLFYAIAFLTLGAAGTPVDLSQPSPSYEEFQRRFWNREIGVATNPLRAAFGRVHWEELRRKLGVAALS